MNRLEKLEAIRDQLKDLPMEGAESAIFIATGTDENKGLGSIIGIAGTEKELEDSILKVMEHNPLLLNVIHKIAATKLITKLGPSAIGLAIAAFPMLANEDDGIPCDCEACRARAVVQSASKKNNFKQNPDLN